MAAEIPEAIDSPQYAHRLRSLEGAGLSPDTTISPTTRDLHSTLRTRENHVPLAQKGCARRIPRPTIRIEEGIGLSKESVYEFRIQDAKQETRHFESHLLCRKPFRNPLINSLFWIAAGRYSRNLAKRRAAVTPGVPNNEVLS